MSAEEPNKYDLIANFGNNKHFDKLLKVTMKRKNAWGDILDDNIHEMIARKGTDKHRDKLINHPNMYVRANVAEYGNENHQKKLMKDYNDEVRSSVARHAPRHIVNDLMDYELSGHYPDLQVLHNIAARGFPEHMDKFKALSKKHEYDKYDNNGYHSLYEYAKENVKK